MTLDVFFEKFDQLADAPGAVAKMRELVLELAVQGRILHQDPNDGTAADLISHLAGGYHAMAAERVRIDEVPFHTPPTWSWVRLGSIALGSDSGWSPMCHTEPRTDTDWGVLKVSAVSWGSFKPEENKALLPGCEPRQNCEVREGDFLLSRANTADLVARSVVVLATPPRLMMSDKIVRFAFPELIDKRYVHLANSSSYARAYYAQRASGTSSSMKNVAREVMNNLPIPLPPLAEQKRIVAKVDELMALCDRLEAQQRDRKERQAVLARASLARFTETPTVENLELLFRGSYEFASAELRKAILTLAVRGKLVPQDARDEPASKFLERIRVSLGNVSDEYYSMGTAGSADSSRDFDLPQGWALARFRGLGEFGRGKSKHRPRNDASLFAGGTHPLVQTGDVARSGGAIQTYTGLYNEVGLAQSKLWPAGTLCITIAANIADAGILQFDACFPDSIVGFIPSKLVPSARFFLYFLSTVKDRLEEYAPSTAQKNINLDVLGQLWIPIPPADEQRRIVAKVDQLMALVDRLEAQLTACRAAATRLLDAIVAELTAAERGAESQPAPAGVNGATGRALPPRSATRGEEVAGAVAGP